MPKAPQKALWQRERNLLQSALTLALAAGLSTGVLAQDKTIKVGVTAGPHAQIFEQAKKVAAKDGLKVQVVSKKVKTLEALKDGAKFGIPNDPTNGGRVLLLLQDKGLIQLKEGAGLKATPLDVVSNPKKLKFVELDAAQLARSLDDLDAAAINTNFAISAGLNPKTDSIAQENAKGPYVNLLVVRAADQEKPWVAQLRKAYQSPEIRSFIESEFKGSVLPAF